MLGWGSEARSATSLKKKRKGIKEQNEKKRTEKVCQEKRGDQVKFVFAYPQQSRPHPFADARFLPPAWSVFVSINWSIYFCRSIDGEKGTLLYDVLFSFLCFCARLLFFIYVWFHLGHTSCRCRCRCVEIARVPLLCIFFFCLISSGSHTMSLCRCCPRNSLVPYFLQFLVERPTRLWGVVSTSFTCHSSCVSKEFFLREHFVQ